MPRVRKLLEQNLVQGMGFRALELGCGEHWRFAFRHKEYRTDGPDLAIFHGLLPQNLRSWKAKELGGQSVMPPMYCNQEHNARRKTRIKQGIAHANKGLRVRFGSKESQTCLLQDLRGHVMIKSNKA